MNRENKLALIIGFTLILVVGVLISDHLSRASSTELNQGLDDSSQTHRRPLSGGMIQSIGETIAAAVPPRQAGPNDSANTQTRINLPTKSAHARALTLNDPDPIVIDQRGGNHESNSGSLGQLASVTGGAVDRILDIYQSSALPHAVELNRGGPQTVIAEPSSSIPTFISYTVEAGENLFRIAERYLGNGERWREIRDNNAGLVGSEGQVAQGAVLRIRVLEPVDARRGARLTRRPPLNDSPRSIDVDTRVYTVQSGDVLGKISQSELGTIRRLDEILALNPELQGDADSIRQGMKIRLPVR